MAPCCEVDPLSMLGDPSIRLARPPGQAMFCTGVRAFVQYRSIHPAQRNPLVKVPVCHPLERRGGRRDRWPRGQLSGTLIDAH